METLWRVHAPSHWLPTSIQRLKNTPWTCITDIDERFFGGLAFVIQDVDSPVRSRPNTEKKLKTRECDDLATYNLFTSRAQFQQSLIAGNWKGTVLGTNFSIVNMHPYMMMHGKVVSGNLCYNSLIRCNEEFWYVVAHLSLNLQSCENPIMWFSLFNLIFSFPASVGT